MARLLVAAALLAAGAAAEEVVTLTSATFQQHLKDNRQTLVEFYAPWCGHCKKLAPEYEKAAGMLKEKGVSLAKVDATEEKDLGSKYNIKGFPTMVWFEDGKEGQYDGGRTAETITEWVTSMIGPAVSLEAPGPAAAERPLMVLTGDSLLPGFEEAAKAYRRKAAWHFQKGGAAKVTLTHSGEEPQELTSGMGSKDKVAAFLLDNALPMYGSLDGDTFDKYMEAAKGLVWSLFPAQESEDYAAVAARHRPMMSEVAKKIRGRYFVTHTDTVKFKEAVDNMLGVTAFPAIAVQKKAGDKRKFVYTGEMTADRISSFIEDVEAGKVEPKLRTEAVPAPNDDPVKVVVGATMKEVLFTPDKDVMLEVYAPWCGHCKKLDPEYVLLAKKIKKEELTDLLTIAKIDGTANDSPVDSIEWSSFPTIYFIKAGTSQAVAYDGERTAKGLWKYIKKHATRAQEIRERLERRKAGGKHGGEL